MKGKLGGGAGFFIDAGFEESIGSATVLFFKGEIDGVAGASFFMVLGSAAAASIVSLLSVSSSRVGNDGIIGLAGSELFLLAGFSTTGIKLSPAASSSCLASEMR